MSRFLNWTATRYDMQEALGNMTSFQNSDYGAVAITAGVTSDTADTSDDFICNQGFPVNTTVDLRSEWGNLYELEVVDAMEYGNQPSNWTVAGPRATTKAMECSNRGASASAKAERAVADAPPARAQKNWRQRRTTADTGNPTRARGAERQVGVARVLPTTSLLLFSPLTLPP
jgi:hypothetical protein